jgi:hypothetical protein
LVAVCGRTAASVVSRYLGVLRSGDSSLLAGVIDCFAFPGSELSLIQDCFVETGIFPILCTLLENEEEGKRKAIICDTIAGVLRGNLGAKKLFCELNGYEILKRALVKTPTLLDTLILILVEASIDYEIRNLDFLAHLFSVFESIKSSIDRLALVNSLTGLIEKNTTNCFILSKYSSIRIIVHRLLRNCTDDVVVYQECLKLIALVARVSVSASDVAAILGLLKPETVNGTMRLTPYYDSVLFAIIRISRSAVEDM